MKDSTITLIIIILALLLTSSAIIKTLWARDKISLPNNITISNEDYAKISQQFENYRYIKVCDLDTGKCSVMTKIPDKK